MFALLLSLGLIFAELSLLAFGGATAILPEMQRQIVQNHGWMSATEFNALFGLAQAAPGPNLIVVTLVGWRVAGWAGAAVATVATLIPAGIVTGVTVQVWDRFRESPWRIAIQIGLVPITVGLIAASAILITAQVAVSPFIIGIIALVAVLSLRTRWHPLYLLALGALAGLSGMGLG